MQGLLLLSLTTLLSPVLSSLQTPLGPTTPATSPLTIHANGYAIRSLRPDEPCSATSAFGTTTDADDTDAPPVTHWSSSTLTTYAYPGTYTDSQLSQYTASTSFTIIFRDFEQLGKLIITLSTMPLVSVREVGWSLTDGTKQALASQMRKEAVRDATRKATDLAEGAGRGVPRVVELADVDVDDRYAHHGRVQLQAAVRMQGGAAATVQQKQNEGMSFAPENVWLSAGVTARFEAV